MEILHFYTLLLDFCGLAILSDIQMHVTKPIRNVFQRNRNQTNGLDLSFILTGSTASQQTNKKVTARKRLFKILQISTFSKFPYQNPPTSGGTPQKCTKIAISRLFINIFGDSFGVETGLDCFFQICTQSRFLVDFSIFRRCRPKPSKNPPSVLKYQKIMDTSKKQKPGHGTTSG